MIASRPSPVRGRGRIRDVDKRVTRDQKAVIEAPHPHAYRDPTICEGCGAVYTQKTWRARQLGRWIPVDAADWALCPACERLRAKLAQGRVVFKGDEALAHEEELRRRVRNVERRARYTQPERRVVSIERRPGGLEVLTTSQQLAHRIAREIEKLWGGHVVYRWSSRDGALFATWQGDQSR